jgi:hypothetical protein
VTSRISTIRPEDLSQELLPSGQKSKIIIGGPSVGKSHYLRNIEDIFMISEFDDIGNGIPDIPVVIDDFYLCFRDYINSDNKEKRKEFEKLMQKKKDVYLSTRPYDLDWLLGHPSLNQPHLSTLKSKEIIFLKYNKDQLVTKYLEFDPHFNVSKINSQEICEKLEYKYTFDELDVSDSYDTYLPALILHISENDLDRALCWSNVSKSLQDSIAHSNIAGFLQKTTDKIPKELMSDVQNQVPDEATSLLSSFMFSSGLFYFVIPLLIYQTFGSNDQAGTQNLLGGLFGEEMLPSARARLEEDFDIPPRSLESLHYLSKPNNYQNILRTIEQNEDSLEDIEYIVRENEEYISNALDEIANIKDTQSSVDEFVIEGIRDAITSPSEITEQEKSRKRDILANEAGLSSSEVDHVFKDIQRDFFRQEEANSLVESILSTNNITVVKGPAGIGKSFFIDSVSSRLSSEECFVGKVNTDNTEFLKARLKYLQGSYDKVFLVYNYRSDDGLDADKFRKLFGDSLLGLFDSLVIECNDSLYEELSAVWERIPDSGDQQLIDELRPPEEAIFTLNTLSPNTVKSIPKNLKLNNSLVDEVIDVSHGNPLIAFEASIIAKNEHEVFDGIVGKRDVIQHRIKSVCQRFEDGSDPGISATSIMESMAVLGRTQTLDPLLDVAGVTEKGKAKDFIIENMRGYIQEIDDMWQLVPEIYRFWLFQDIWFDERPPTKRRNSRSDYLDRIEESYEPGYNGCAVNLGQYWENSDLSFQGEGYAVLQDAIEEILRAASYTREYDSCLYNICLHRFPITQQRLLDTRLFEWLESQDKGDLPAIINLLNRSFANLTVSFSSEGCKTEFDRYVRLVDQITSYAGEIEKDLFSMYTCSVGHQLTRHVNPENAHIYFDTVEYWVKETSNEPVDTQLISFYSYVLVPYVNDKPPSRLKPWFVFLNERLQDAPFEDDRTRVIFRVYGRMLSSANSRDPSEINEHWFIFLDEKVQDASFGDDWTRDIFRVNQRLPSSTYPADPSEIDEPWLTFTEEILQEHLESDYKAGRETYMDSSFKSSEFSKIQTTELLYANILSGVLKCQSFEDAEGWVDKAFHHLQEEGENLEDKSLLDPILAEFCSDIFYEIPTESGNLPPFDEVEDWYYGLLDRVTSVIEEENLIWEIFFANLLATVAFRYIDVSNEAKKWVMRIESSYHESLPTSSNYSSIRQNGIDQKVSLNQRLHTFYIISIKIIMSTYGPGERDTWIRYLLERDQDQAGGGELPILLGQVFGQGISPEYAESWYNWMEAEVSNISDPSISTLHSESLKHLERRRMEHSPDSIPLFDLQYYQIIVKRQNAISVYLNELSSPNTDKKEVYQIVLILLRDLAKASQQAGMADEILENILESLPPTKEHYPIFIQNAILNLKDIYTSDRRRNIIDKHGKDIFK